jgi:hypothetical protein
VPAARDDCNVDAVDHLLIRKSSPNPFGASDSSLVNA